MCGIALIVSGIRFHISSFISDSPRKSHKLLFTLDDLKASLRRRGPDSLGVKKVLLHHNVSAKNPITSVVEDDDDEVHELQSMMLCSGNTDNSGQCDNFSVGKPAAAELRFIGATLQLRGINPQVQPLVDSSGNVLVYNGEIFGGHNLASDCNDSEFLMQALGKCCSCGSCLTGECVQCGKSSIADVLSTIKGPWAIIYWQGSSNTLWFGRDAFGRRSLLVHWPTEDDPTFLLSSVSPVSPSQQESEYEAPNGMGCLSYWEELPCGIYHVYVNASNTNGHLVGEIKKYEFTNSMLNELIKWERTSIEPNSEDLQISRHEFSRRHDMHSPSLEAVPCELGSTQPAILTPAHILLNALKESVLRRTSLYTIYQAMISGIKQESFVPVAVLFSGGLDSMILAALLDQCLDPIYEIDLLNVSFDGQFAPDRISAKAGLKELKRVAPCRRWRLVEIDANLSDLVLETSHVMSLINPANTFMDLNIGIALWLASGGEGCLPVANGDENDDNHARIRYKSTARILLVGSGADEQCAGYGRHRTSYRRGSWLGLHEEMRLDMQRIWKRNLGRDDRCIADNGKEARFPFLDEDVIRVLLNIPLWEVANLDQPSGIGDKVILREVAKMLGLFEAAVLPKRAIQFGSRIARESNRKNFGSNRAANQASAGSVGIYKK